ISLIVWALLIICFLVLHPNPRSFLFWFLLIPGIVFGLSYMRTSHREDKSLEKDFVEWQKSLKVLVDTWDFHDDGHLYDSLDKEERDRIVKELKEMTPGKRSLRKAIGIVCPDLIRKI